MIAYWEAFDRRRPIGFQWEQHAAVMSMLEAILAAQINLSPHVDEKHRYEVRGMESFLPSGLREKKKTKGSLRKQLQLLARVYGGSYGDDDSQKG